MDQNGYFVCHLESDKDVEDELALMRLSFTGEKVDEMVERLLANHPGFNRSSFLTVRHGGRIVASLCMIPLTWNIGGVPLKTVEMGMVATHPDFRKRGLQRILNTEYDQIVKNQGYDISVIEGIPFFYRQFGYEYTIPLDSETVVPLDKLPRDLGGTDIRPFEDSDIPTAMEQVLTSQDKLLVHSMRSREIWEGQQRTGWQGGRQFVGYVLEVAGKPVAYFRVSHQEGHLYLIDSSVIDRGQAIVVLGFLKQLGEANGSKALVSRLGHENIITREILARGGDANRPYGWQVKVLDTRNLCYKLRPLLNSRLQSSPFAGLSDSIRINMYWSCLAIKIEGGEVTEVEKCDGKRSDGVLLNPLVFPKLLLGVRDIEELMLEYPDVIVAPHYRGLVNTLFPKGNSFIQTCY